MVDMQVFECEQKYFAEVVQSDFLIENKNQLLLLAVEPCDFSPSNATFVTVEDCKRGARKLQEGCKLVANLLFSHNILARVLHERFMHIPRKNVVSDWLDKNIAVDIVDLDSSSSLYPNMDQTKQLY